jgi:hypothetical protein
LGRNRKRQGCRFYGRCGRFGLQRIPFSLRISPSRVRVTSLRCRRSSFSLRVGPFRQRAHPSSRRVRRSSRPVVRCRRRVGMSGRLSHPFSAVLASVEMPFARVERPLPSVLRKRRIGFACPRLIDETPRMHGAHSRTRRDDASIRRAVMSHPSRGLGGG